jgi:hypothetical protein
MQQPVKALKFAAVGVVGTAGAILLTLSMIDFAVPRAEATPAMAKGKPCGACHASSKPSKSDVKKKRSEIWPDGADGVIARLSPLEN